MTEFIDRTPCIEADGWMLVSAEEQQRSHPTVDLPGPGPRQNVKVGQAVKLLFDIETREGGRVIDRGVDRMWVIVTGRDAIGYVGILDSDPGRAENLRLRSGDRLRFVPEHIAANRSTTSGLHRSKYGAGFWEE